MTEATKPLDHSLQISRAPQAMRKVVDAFNRGAHRVGDLHQAGAWAITRQDGRQSFDVKLKMKNGRWSRAVTVGEPTEMATRGAIGHLLSDAGESVSFPF